MSKFSYAQLINTLVERINNAAEFSASTNRTEADLARRDLIAAAEQLLIAARSPEENLVAIAQQPAQNAALRCAIALGIPDALPIDGSPRSADDIASELGVDRTLLSRILRACACTFLLGETSELHYAHNALSRTLLSPANRAFLKLMFDYNGRAVIALPEFLEARKWQDPGSYTDCSFMLGSQTDLPMWEYRDQDETCREVFDLGMKAEILGAVSTGKASGPFPFGDELSVTIKNSEQIDTVTIVDLGGGRGQALQGIREDYPELSAARFVLVDLGPAIQSALSAGLPTWIEPVVGSFFEPLTIFGADVYYIRRCMHNWDDPACSIILRHVAAAMNATRSRLLIEDMVLVNTDAAKSMAWEDFNMMTIGGVERTERHWETLLGDTGFRVHKIWRHGPTERAIIDARLK